MGFKDIVSSVIDKTTEAVKTMYKGSQLTQGNVEIYADMETLQKMRMFQNKFFQAKGVWEQNWTLMNKREAIYDGTHEVEQNINDGSKTRVKKLSNNVRNIVYELIESCVDNNIPMPTVRAKTGDGNALAQMIEDSIKNDLEDSKINKINDKLERTTMKHGYSAVEVAWNPDFKHHLYRGEVEFNTIHPKQIVPQTNVYDIDNMDYIFVLYSRTKGYLKRKYGVDLGLEREQFPEVNYIPTEQEYTNTQYEKVTEIVCWYKDEDGDVGKFSWVNSTPLEDLPKFYYRRLLKCTKCNKTQQDKVCECGNKKFKDTIQEYETLTEAITLKRVDPQTNQPVVIPAGTKIPYFAPQKFPIIIRTNVPSDFGFGGISDIDAIADQQDVIKKLTNNIEEKILRGGTVIKKLTGHKVNLTNALHQVVEGDPQQLMALGAIDLRADISKEMEFLQTNYQAAKDTLGITNAWQGKSDSANESGRLNQQKIQQSSGRMQSKIFNKLDFYKQLFEMDFWFKLAYYDELRPYVTTDLQGNDSYGDFSKYEFLQKDKAGEWYYNTDFLFSADAGDGIPKDKMWLFNNNTQMMQHGAYNPSPASIIFWNQLQQLKYPNAEMIADMLQQQYQQSIAMRAAMNMPKETINFKDLPPEGQIQMAQKIGVNLTQGTENMYNTMPMNNQVNNVTVPPQQGQDCQQMQQGPEQQQPNPWQVLTNNLSHEELNHLEQHPEHVLQHLQQLKQSQGGEQSGK